MAVEIPHFTLPFSFVSDGTGGLVAGVAEQESVAEIESCAEAILRTVQGQRTTLPDFGRPELEFNTDPELVRATLAAALLEWEPRVQALVTAWPDAADESVQVIRALVAPADSEEGDQS
jgi:phage baseplate assembly protein W